jgi:curved DNA-binding protein CbpA
MTHYDTLEVSSKASPDVVRAAYRSLIQRFHPDRRPGDADAARRAAAITEAYEVLSDPARRAAYDETLAPTRGAAATAARGNRHGDGATARAPRAAAAAGARWLWAALAVPVVAGAFWLGAPKPDPQAELASIRVAFAGGGLPEAKLRELHARRQALVRQFPELRARAFAEEAQDRDARSVELLSAPLVLQLDRAEITIPRLRIVLGSFDAGSLRAHMGRQSERLQAGIAQAVARADAAQLTGPAGEDYLKALVLAALARELGTQPLEDYPSTYFESPGRHGAVDVLLPQHYQLRPL